MNRNRASVRARGSLVRTGLLIGPMKPGNARSLSRKRRSPFPSQPHEQPQELSLSGQYVPEQASAVGVAGGMTVPAGVVTVNRSAGVGGPAAEASGAASSSGSRARHRIMDSSPPEAADS